MSIEKEEKVSHWNIHSCDLCHYGTKSAVQLYRHMERHADPESFDCESKTPELYQCELCPFVTHLKLNVTEHCRVTHEWKEANDMLLKLLKLYECNTCDFRTCSLLVLLNHVAGCNWTLQDYEVDNHNPVEQIECFKCDHCPKKYKYKSCLQKHLSIHNRLPEWYHCDKCSFKSKYKHYMKYHVLSKHTSSEEKEWFECHHCSKRFVQKPNLRQHIELMHSQSVNWFYCDECSYKTKFERVLKLHLLHRHKPSEVVKVECEYCSMTFKRRDTFLTHMKQHDSSKEWRYCEKCTYRTKIKSRMRRHVFSKHTPEEEIEWFKCQYCDKRFKYRQSLQGHFEVQHDESTEWLNCDSCSFKTKTKANMKSHVLNIHSFSKIGKGYQCSHCSKKYRRKKQLLQHFKRYHAGIVRRNRYDEFS